jgi:hypothetical protein
MASITTNAGLPEQVLCLERPNGPPTGIIREYFRVRSSAASCVDAFSAPYAIIDLRLEQLVEHWHDVEIRRRLRH